MAAGWGWGAGCRVGVRCRLEVNRYSWPQGWWYITRVGLHPLDYEANEVKL